MGNLYEYLDDLSLGELINLRKTANADAVPVIDSVIHCKTFSNTYVHKYEMKNKENRKLKVKQKINKSYKRDSEKNRRR